MTVFAVIIGLPKEEGKILLVQDKDERFPPMWKLPGGRVEVWESPDVALYRELDEEVGAVVYPVEDEDVIFEVDLGDHIFRVYKAAYYDGEISQCSDEIEKIKTFSVGEMAQLLVEKKILPRHAAAIERYLALREKDAPMSVEKLAAEV
ncbi:MAG: NUDIX hydrolase [Spirochaetia bacterium]|nr:MAG: NUDIX hydrolase [Spirochaetia bacterium]